MPPKLRSQGQSGSATPSQPSSSSSGPPPVEDNPSGSSSSEAASAKPSSSSAQTEVPHVQTTETDDARDSVFHLMLEEMKQLRQRVADIEQPKHSPAATIPTSSTVITESATDTSLPSDAPVTEARLPHQAAVEDDDPVEALHRMPQGERDAFRYSLRRFGIKLTEFIDYAKTRQSSPPSSSATTSTPSSSITIATSPPSTTTLTPSVVATVTPTTVSPFSGRTPHCKPEFLGVFDGDPNELENFLSTVHDIYRSNDEDPAWEKAVLRTLPLVMKGDAKVWRAGLSDAEAKQMTSLDAWSQKLREAFPVNQFEQRRLARTRQWVYNVEPISAYFFYKLRLLRSAYGGDCPESTLVHDVLDGLPATFRVMLRLPRVNVGLQDVRQEISEWEPMWRELHSHQRPSSSAQASSSPTRPRPTAPTPARAVTSSSSITAAAPVVPSVDTGASLSIIDAKLLESLGGQPQGDGMWVHGLGNKQTLGWVTATVFIESKDSAGEIVHVECQQDFHVLSDFSPGLCLGLDFITTHRLTLLPALGTASMGPYRFPVHEHVLGPYAKEPELRVADDVVAPPGCYVWIPVDASCLAPGVDYTVHPRLSVSEDDGFQLAGPAAVLTHKARRHILLGNFGTESRTLTRGTVIADATAAHLGDAVSEPGESFTLEAPLPTVFAATVPTEPSDVATPVNPFEGTDGDGSDLTRDAATVVVDDHFRVGVGADGTPPAEIVDVLRRHRDAFALDGRPGRIRDSDEMTVELKPDAALRPEAPRRASPEKRKAMDAAIDQLLDWDVIEPSSSPVSFPVLMIRQYDKWRFCVDYRQLNAATVSDRYPLPTIDSIFQTLLGKTVFSSLDAIRGYHQMPVRESDRWKTAFVCHRGLYQYKTVPFGLKNAPAVFQRLMDRILGSLRWQHAVVYIDDIVIASRSLHEHAEALSTLLRTATAVGLRFSPGKCTFAVPSLVLLGRKISGAGVAVWADRANAVGALQRPTTLKALYHVLGLFGYYRAFVPRFAEIAAPLSALTKGWRYEASADGRSRLINTEGRPVSADKEILDWGTAQQQSFDRLKAAIAQPPTLAHPDPARPYVLYVDASKDAFAAILHQVFEDPMAASPPTPTAAAMSMVPVQLLPPSIAKERWAAWLRSDRYFAPLMRDAESGAADSPWILEAGVLLRRTDGKLALPEAAVSEVMRSAHDGNGHFGFLKTYLAVSQSFWRPGLSVLVRAWVRHCAICQRTKRIPKVGSLDIEQDPQYPFNTISIDVLHGFPRTRSGNESVVAIHDVFSKMILLEPCSAGITAEGIAAIVSNRVLRFGWRPRRIVSDSEARVSGSVMTSLAESLHADLTPSPPHHQQANAVERAIQTVQQVLKALAVDGSAHWDRRLIPAIELAMNSTPSLVTGFRPFDLVFLSHPDAAHAVFDAEDHLGVSAFSERVAAAGERLHDARQATFAARTDQKRRYDRRRRPLAQLQPGDEVYVRLDDRPIPGLSVGKLDARKAGPYKVASVLSPHWVRLDLPADSKISDEFSVEQLDLAPRSPDPFEHARVPSTPVMLPSPPLRPSVRSSSSDADIESLPADLEVVGSRSRQLPVGLRDFQLGVARASSSDSLADALRGPVYRTRTLEVDGVSITLRERPVVFLSRLTSVTEQRMVAPELELCCLAWAFARLAHLLEGAEVTVVTDHAPLGPMLTSTSGIPYGPTITRCRALLMPHLHNLRFVHRAGSTHTNADALSRLPPAI